MYPKEYKFKLTEIIDSDGNSRRAFLSEKSVDINDKQQFLETTNFYVNLFNTAIDHYDFIEKAIVDILKVNKKIYKKTMKSIDKNGLDLQSVLPPLQNKESDILLFLYPILSLNAFDAYTKIGTNEYRNHLDLWLQDKNFRIFYKKVLLVFKLIKDGSIQFSFSQKELADKTMYLFSIQGILLAYYLNNMNTDITQEHIKSFFSKAFDWKECNVDFNLSLNLQQKEIMREITTGIKYELLKKEQIHVNNIYTKSKTYSVLEDMSNNIKVHYISGKNGKHYYHKLPKLHWRRSHWRQSKNGTKVWIEGKWVGGNEELNAA